MNRIYQGKVTAVEIPDGKDEPGKPLDLDVLWHHHELFQDAVNYYLVCLLALAAKGNDVYPIREKLDAKNEAGGDDDLMIWRPFSRRGAKRRGLRDSVAPYFCPGQSNATPEDCFAAVLAGSDVSADTRNLALEELLFMCEGDNPIKTQGRWMFDRFCNPAYTGGFPFDVAKDLRVAGEARLQSEFHTLQTESEFKVFAEQLRLGWVVTETKNAKPFVGEEARGRLLKAVAHFRQAFGEKAETEMGGRMSAFLTSRSEADMNLIEITNRIRTAQPDTLPILPRNNRSIPDRLEAAILFKTFPCTFTAELLKVSFPPAKPKTSIKRKKADSELPAVRFTRLGGDAIELARGQRGYIFRAFTSLKNWSGGDTPTPRWLLFDVLAFKEALKALHQIESKKEERDEQQTELIEKLEYQRQCTLIREKSLDGSVSVNLDLKKAILERKAWKANAEGEETQPAPIIVGDPRIKRLEELLSSDLAVEDSMNGGEEVEHGLQPRTIRGFREVRKKWNDALGENAQYTDAARTKLWNLLTDYKKENVQTMGSPAIFDAMVEEKNWLIWREPTAEQLREWRKAARLPDDAEFAKDPLQALTDERELLSDIERLRGPIRLTPADPEHSRRQFYFSDASALDKKNRLRHDQQTLDTEVAVAIGGKWEVKWVRIHFTAPRLLRDQLNNTTGADSAWQQAMMTALGLKAGLTKTEKGEVRAATFAECTAVALMPEIGANGEKRILLNFPLTLDGEAIAKQLGKAARWDGLQFGGADKESYWLRWPTTWIDEKKERKKAPPAPWWKSAESFRCLSVDLGQRDAGAFALLEASQGNPPKPGISRKLGVADGKTWWATVRATGMLRLPGEDALVMRDGKWQEEFSGERGRNLVAGEWQETRGICTALGFQPDKLLGTDERRYPFPEANDQLLYASRRAQSRLARLQSWSCVAHKESDEKKRAASEKRRTRIKEQIVEAITTREADKIKAAKDHGQELLERGHWLDEVKNLVEKEAWDAIAIRIKKEIESERAIIQRELIRIADRIQPLRGRQWEWARREDGINYMLRQTIRGSDGRAKLLAGQRGLSMERIEQLESLRQRCQSLNRALRQEPGQPPNLGKSKRGIELPDPCPELLDRLDALKEQRVNQTAHMILAQALGVRLRAHADDAAARAARDIHGEYERIPGREPVDFLVLENLDRYLASQGRSRGENSKLMKWSHRAILGKLKQLCEPYGLRVLETPAAYSSRFCSLTGVAGFRAVELTPDSAKEFRWKKHLDRLADPEREKKLSKDERAESQRVQSLFAELERMNTDIRKANPARPKWRTLLAPVAGGPIFIPASDMEWFDRKNRKTGRIEKVWGFKPIGGSRPVVAQADINAAINLGLRAIAAPDTSDIHLRIRAKREGEKFVVRADNKREKARWGDKLVKADVLKESERKKLLADAHLNFFADLSGVAEYDQAEIAGEKGFASGRGIWGTIKGNERHTGKDWLRVEEINRARIQKWERGDDDVRM